MRTIHLIIEFIKTLFVKSNVLYCKNINWLVANLETINNKWVVVPVDWVITYYVDNHTEDFSSFRQNIIFHNVFLHRQKVFKNKIMFKKVDTEEAKIRFYFRKNWDSDLPVEFKEKSIAFWIAPWNKTYSWNIYINDEKDFSLMWEWDSFALLKVLTHEIWHVLNLGHSDDPEDIMYFEYNRSNFINITKDTEDTILWLYKQYM